MKINPYVGHASQLCGVEDVRLVGGKGDGMRLLQHRNAKGLTISFDTEKLDHFTQWKMMIKGGVYNEGDCCIVSVRIQQQGKSSSAEK